jgi:hypothetical protein
MAAAVRVFFIGLVLFQGEGIGVVRRRRAAQHGVELHLLEERVLARLGEGVHLVHAPGDADDRARGALAGCGIGQRQIGVDDQLRVGGFIAGQHLGKARDHGCGHLAEVAIGRQHIRAGGRLSGGQQVRGERAGLDQRHVDAEGGHLVAQALAVGFQRVFRRAIGAEEGHRDPPGEGAGVDDQAAPAARIDGSTACIARMAPK